MTEGKTSEEAGSPVGAEELEAPVTEEASLEEAEAAEEVVPEETEEAAAEAPPEDPEADTEVPSENGAEEAAVEDPADEATPAVDDWTDEELVRATAALVFASPDPLSEGRLVSLLGGVTAARVRESLEALGQSLESSGLPFVLKAIAGGWRLFTAPEMSEVVTRLARARKIERISPAALETLAIIAYRQPVTKAEIEAIRGVQAGAILRSLVDRGLAKVTGRADQPGSPLQYGTTKEFLDRFELESLKDLPRDGELVRD